MIVYTDKRRVPFQIDGEDYEAVRRYSWHMGGSGYPTTHVWRRPHSRLLSLHVFLMGPAPKGLQWDHVNRDKMDNRRENLRAVTQSVNARNTGLLCTNTSGVRGVSWYARDSRWEARIYINGRQKHLGCFRTLSEAVAARVAAEADCDFNSYRRDAHGESL